MTNKEILEKAIGRAEENEYSKYPGLKELLLIKRSFIENDILYNGEKYDEEWSISIMEIIFDHEFAKAFWGDDRLDILFDNFNQITRREIAFNGELYDNWDELGGLHWVGECWKYHLQQMIMEENPLEYLEKFL